MSMKEFIDPFTGEPVKQSKKKASLRDSKRKCCGCWTSIGEDLTQQKALIGPVEITSFTGGYD